MDSTYLTLTARHEPEEEQHQLPPVENVPQDQGTPQAGLKIKLSIPEHCISLVDLAYGGLHNTIHMRI
jgi:hypothetical protein